MISCRPLLPLTVAVLAACATPTTTANPGVSASDVGTVRVTNYTRDAVQVFLVSPNGDTYLRLIQPGNSESFHVPGSRPGDVVQLKAKTSSLREYTSHETITLAGAGCAKSLDTQQKRSDCEWRLP